MSRFGLLVLSASLLVFVVDGEQKLQSWTDFYSSPAYTKKLEVEVYNIMMNSPEFWSFMRQAHYKVPYSSYCKQHPERCFKTVPVTRSPEREMNYRDYNSASDDDFDD